MKIFIALGVAAALLVIALLLQKHRLRSSSHSQYLLLTLHGRNATQNAVQRLSTDGREIHAVLKSARGRRYLFASGYSLSKPLLLVVEQREDGAPVRRTVFREPDGKERRLASFALDGLAVISPDYQKYAFIGIHAPTAPYQVSVFNIEGESRLYEHTFESPDGWDASPCWSHDSSRLLFLHFVHESSGIRSRLIELRLATGVKRTVLGESEYPLQACYSPSGDQIAVITRQGLELMDIEAKHRRTLVNVEQIGRRTFWPGGMTWIASENAVAFVVRDKENTSASEVWSISLASGNAARLHRFPNGVVHGLQAVSQ